MPLPRLMKTEVLDSKNRAHLNRAVDLLRHDRLVALPTETVYGLAGNGLSAAAVKKIYEAKGRPSDNPLILHTDLAEKARHLFCFASAREQERFELLSKAFWPGPLTIVGTKSSLITREISAGLPTVAVRLPASLVTQNVLSLLDFPLAMPSANLSKRPSPTNGAEVLKTLEGRIDAVVMGEQSAIGLESSVVRIDLDEVYMLRPGAITPSSVGKILLEPVVFAQNSSSVAASPGCKHAHYVPNVRSIIWGDDTILAQSWRSNATILCRNKDQVNAAKELGSRPKTALTLALGDDPADFGRFLYSALYRAEEKAHESLIILPPKEETEAWKAALDRMRRAAGYQ